jgi:transcription initiation factor IIE alpha subunit
MPPGLKGSAAMVYMTILQAAQNGTCRLSQEQIAQRTHYCERTIRTATKILYERNLVEITRNYRDRTYMYRIVS